MPTATQRAYRWLWVPMVLLFLVSLALPAVYQHGFGAPTSGLKGSVLPGYAMLANLPFAMLSPSWWANPVWTMGVIGLIREKTTWAWCCGLVATLLALLALVLGPFPPDNFQLSHFRVGYWVWLSSMVALLVTATVEIRHGKRRHQNR